MSYYYPFTFITEALTPIGTSAPAGLFETATGLTGLTESGCPTPDFPVVIEYTDTTQVFQYNTPNLEKRINTAHTLPRAWTLNYPAILDTEILYLRTFYLARKGGWEHFYFIDPDRYVFDDSFPYNLTVNPDLVTNNDYVCKARFGNNYSAERIANNWYSITFKIIEVF